MLLNGQAACYMHMGKYDDAESLLQEALERVRLSVNKFLLRHSFLKCKYKCHLQLKLLELVFH